MTTHFWDFILYVLSVPGQCISTHVWDSLISMFAKLWETNRLNESDQSVVDVVWLIYDGQMVTVLSVDGRKVHFYSTKQHLTMVYNSLLTVICNTDP